MLREPFRFCEQLWTRVIALTNWNKYHKYSPARTLEIFVESIYLSLPESEVMSRQPFCFQPGVINHFSRVVFADKNNHSACWV